MIMIREGMLDVTIAGNTTRLGPGSVAYVASNEEHGWRNAGTDRAKYFVLALGRDKPLLRCRRLDAHVRLNTANYDAPIHLSTARYAAEWNAFSARLRSAQDFATRDQDSTVYLSKRCCVTPDSSDAWHVNRWSQRFCRVMYSMRCFEPSAHLRKRP